jgi:hypothetical protein
MGEKKVQEKDARIIVEVRVRRDWFVTLMVAGAALYAGMLLIIMFRIMESIVR